MQHDRSLRKWRVIQLSAQVRKLCSDPYRCNFSQIVRLIRKPKMVVHQNMNVCEISQATYSFLSNIILCKPVAAGNFEFWLQVASSIYCSFLQEAPARYWNHPTSSWFLWNNLIYFLCKLEIYYLMRFEHQASLAKNFEKIEAVRRVLFPSTYLKPQ